MYSELMVYFLIFQVLVEFAAQVFAALIGPNFCHPDTGFLATQPALVLFESGKCLTLMLEELELGLLTKIVCETNIVVTAAQACGLHGPPEVSVNEFTIV